jgi:2-haloacid dehalogenase
LFRDTVVSGDEKLIKPDPAIFHLLAKRNGIDLTDSLFIDDSLKNVVGAEAVGMTAHHFTTPESLRATLSKLGVL